MVPNIGHSYLTKGKKLVVITQRIVLNDEQTVYVGVKPSLTALPAEHVLYSSDGSASTLSDDSLDERFYNLATYRAKNVEVI